MFCSTTCSISKPGCVTPSSFSSWVSISIIIQGWGLCRNFSFLFGFEARAIITSWAAVDHRQIPLGGFRWPWCVFGPKLEITRWGLHGESECYSHPSCKNYDPLFSNFRHLLRKSTIWLLELTILSICKIVPLQPSNLALSSALQLVPLPMLHPSCLWHVGCPIPLWQSRHQARAWLSRFRMTW